MALFLLATPVSGNTISLTAYTNEFNNIYQNAVALISPLTAAVNANSKEITNFSLETLSATPSTQKAGRLVFLTVGKQFVLDDGAQIRFVPAHTSLSTGDIPIATSSNQIGKLAIGTTGQILQVTGGLPAWTSALSVTSIYVPTIITTSLFATGVYSPTAQHTSVFATGVYSPTAQHTSVFATGVYSPTVQTTSLYATGVYSPTAQHTSLYATNLYAPTAQFTTVAATSIAATTVQAHGSLTVGGGSAIQKIVSATGSCVWPAMNADATIATTITISGATGTDQVLVSHSAVTTASVLMFGYVSAADTVTVSLYNGTGAVYNPGSGTLRATLFKYV